MGKLTLRLSLRQEKGRKECKDGGRNEAEDSGMQNGGSKDMREDEEQGRRTRKEDKEGGQGRRTRKEEGGRTTRSTGLRLKLVLRTGISHVLSRYERAKYRIETKFGTSRQEFTRFTTF